jgi:hypothetical protein
MDEEKTENQQDLKQGAPKAEAPKETAPKAEDMKTEAPKTESPKAQTAAKGAEEKATLEKKKKEKPANCAVCNKSIRKKRYYYRNGKYYCTKRCWKTTIKKEEKTLDTKNPSDAKDQAPPR